MSALTEAWLQSVTDPHRYGGIPLAELDAALGRMLANARATWPEANVEPAAFIASVARRLEPEGTVEQALNDARAADLYIAHACAAGDRPAIEALDRRLIASLAGTLRRTSKSAERIADALQELRAKLFVQGRIADYTGRGGLASWLRVAATRTLLHQIEKTHREQVTEEPAVEDALLAHVDPELEYVKARYRNDFHGAFRAALARLSVDERNVLRMHVIDRLNIAEIGALRRIHRATVARWIAEIRGKILEGTRAELGLRLHVRPEELDSVLGLLCSQLDQSLHRFLVATPAPA